MALADLIAQRELQQRSGGMSDDQMIFGLVGQLIQQQGADRQMGEEARIRLATEMAKSEADRAAQMDAVREASRLEAKRVEQQHEYESSPTYVKNQLDLAAARTGGNTALNAEQAKMLEDTRKRNADQYKLQHQRETMSSYNTGRTAYKDLNRPWSWQSATDIDEFVHSVRSLFAGLPPGTDPNLVAKGLRDEHERVVSLDSDWQNPNNSYIGGDKSELWGRVLGETLDQILSPHASAAESALRGR